jgi:hypothetical protein
MKPHLVVAVAGAVIINSLGLGKPDKKNDSFLKADIKYLKNHEKKYNDSVNSSKTKHWRTCKGMV